MYDIAKVRLHVALFSVALHFGSFEVFSVSGSAPSVNALMASWTTRCRRISESLVTSWEKQRALLNCKTNLFSINIFIMQLNIFNNKITSEAAQKRRRTKTGKRVSEWDRLLHTLQPLTIQLQTWLKNTSMLLHSISCFSVISRFPRL